MDTAASLQLAQVHSRREVIADDWYRAIAPTAFVPLDVAQVRQRVNDLTEQVITLVLTDPLDCDAARSIGVALVRLHYIQPESLAATLQVLPQQLIAGLPAEQAMTLYPRLTTLLSELAAGFTTQAIETLLAEQEQIRQALDAERLQAEDTLRKSEALYHAVVEDQTELIARFLPGGTLTFVNEAYGRYFAARPEELIGRNFIPIVLDKDRERMEQQLASLNRENPVVAIEARVVMADGQIRWQQWTNRAIFDEQGRLIEFQAVGRDITEQRQMEESLIRHAQEMAALYKTSLEINSQLEVPLLLQAIVQRAARLVGTQMGGLYFIKSDGQTLELVVSHNLPGDYLGVTLCLGEGLAGRVAQTGKPMAIDDYLHWEGRAAAYASASFRCVLGVPLQVRDRVIGVITINDDIRTGSFDEDEIRLVSLFADQAAIAIEKARLYQAEREQRELAETLREVGATLVSTLDVNTVLDRILEQVGRVAPSDVSDIMLVKGDYACFARWRGYERFGTPDLTSVTFLVAGTHNLQHMVETGEPVVIHDVHTDPQWIHVPGTERLRSYAGVPIRVRGETIGFLAVHSVTPGHFEWTDAERLCAFADQAAIALENARLFEDARRTAERLQALSHRMVEVQEAERHLIARELHDEIGQTLTAVKINLQALQRSSDAFRHAAILEENVTVIERALQQVRNLSLDLRPSLLDDLGLVPALRWHVNRQAERAGFTAVFTTDALEARLSPDLEIACFRVVQEALTNVVRHARAQHVLVELQQRDTELELTIRDDGVGFDVQSALERAMHGASLGLLGMDERVSLVGGQMEIESVPMRGTEIRARFPLALPSSKAQGPPVG